MTHHLEDLVREALHPEAPMPFEPKRPVGPGQPPLGCHQQGRYPPAAEPCVDPDEIEAHRLQEPEPEPWWPKVLGIVAAIILIAVIFAPVGVK